MYPKNTVTITLILMLVCNAVFAMTTSNIFEKKTVCNGTSDRVESYGEILSTRFAGGDGSVGNPYQISNVTHLQNMNTNESAHYVLINDINATETASWNNGDGFDPVGNNVNRFTGSLDGKGYKIYYLTINRPSEDNTGRFRFIEGSVSNLTLIGNNILGNYYVGGLAGSIYSGSINNSFSTGNVSGYSYIGGLVGYSYRGIVDNSYITGNVNGSSFIGGLVGSNNGIVKNSYVTGNLSGIGSRIGGLVGRNRYGSVENCHAIGNVSGDEDIGGLVGQNYYGSVENSYATSNVSGNKNVGGLVGSSDHGFVENSFYCINYTIVNGKNLLAPYGIYMKQFDDWIGDGKTIDIDDHMQQIPGKNYYKISSIADIKTMLSFTKDNHKFRQTANIDLSLEPGLYIPVFSAGEYDGNGFLISNMNLSINYNDRIGLFGMVGSNTQISNVSLIDVDITGNDYVGALVGYNYGSVSDSYATGSGRGNDYIGGLVGYHVEGSVENSYAAGSVGGNDRVGGLVGDNHDGSVENSYATGSVSGKDQIGGLIGKNGGSVKNCYATDNVSGNDRVGGLIGKNGGSVKNSYTTGNVSGEDQIGGLVGINDEGAVMNCNATGNVNGRGDNVGGLVGGNNYGIVEESSAIGAVNGNISIGGLVGINYGKVENCFATGAVSGSIKIGGLIGYNGGKAVKCYASGSVSGIGSKIGGFVGENRNGEVFRCYATGSVSGDHEIGGLVGFNRNSKVLGCYSIGRVIGESELGGLIGENRDGTVLASFWDNQTSGQSTSYGGTGMNTTRMMTKKIFMDAYWDFVSIWNIIESSSYPYLRSFDYLNIITSNDEVTYEDNIYRMDYDAISLVPGNPPLSWHLSTNASEWLKIDKDGVLEGIPLNDDVGTYWVKVSAVHNADTLDFTNFTLTVNNTNDAPEIITAPTKVIYEDSPFFSDYSAIDVDPTFDELYWFFESNAPFLIFNNSTGNLSGTPANSDVGLWWVNISVEDGKGGNEFKNYTLTVINTNDAPGITTTPIVTSNEDNLYYLDCDAIDIDPTSDELLWSFESNASFLTINSSTGNLSGIPTNSDVGTWWVHVTVEDGNNGTDSINYTLSVINTNDAPEVNSTQSRVKFDEDTAWYGINLNDVFRDIDGDELDFSNERNDNITIEICPNSTVLFTPQKDWCGTEKILFFANDSKEGISTNIIITVTPINDAPTNASIRLENFNYYEGRTQPAYANATDVDLPFGDNLQFLWTFNSSNKSLTGNSVNLSLLAGNHTVTLVVSDLEGFSINISMAITILEDPLLNDIDTPDGPDSNETGDKESSSSNIFYLGIGGAILVIVIAVIILMFLRKRSLKNGEQKKSSPSDSKEEPVQLEKGQDISWSEDYEIDITNQSLSTEEPTFSKELTSASPPPPPQSSFESNLERENEQEIIMEPPPPPPPPDK